MPKFGDLFSLTALLVPCPRYTLEEIAQRIAMRKGLSFKAVYSELLDLVEGEAVPNE